MLTFFKCFKRLDVKQKYVAEKDDLKILRCPYVTFNNLRGHNFFKENLCLHFSIHIFFLIKIGS